MRVVTAPLRPIGLDAGVRAQAAERGRARRAASAGTARNGRPVMVVIPTYGAPGRGVRGGQAAAQDQRRGRARGSWWSTTPAPPSDQRRLRELEGMRSWSWPSENARLRGQREPRHRAATPDEDVVVLNNDVIAHTRLAGAAPAGRLRRGRDRHRRAPAAVPRRPHPVGRLLPQHGRARVVRPPLPLPRRGLRARRDRRRRDRGHRRVHVPQARR